MQVKDENRENGFTIWEIGSIEIFYTGRFYAENVFLFKENNILKM